MTKISIVHISPIETHLKVSEWMLAYMIGNGKTTYIVNVPNLDRRACRVAIKKHIKELKANKTIDPTRLRVGDNLKL